LQEALPEMRDLGAAVVAVSPQTGENAAAMVEKNNLTFQCLVDPGSNVARAYKIVFKLPDDAAALLQGKVDLTKVNGTGSNELPIPAVYIIDNSGVVRFSALDPDFRNQTDPKDIIAALKQIKELPSAPASPAPAAALPPAPEPPKPAEAPAATPESPKPAAPPAPEPAKPAESPAPETPPPTPTPAPVAPAPSASAAWGKVLLARNTLFG
jgi:peroxiredoxin